MPGTDPAKQLAQELAAMKRRIAAIERGGQLAHSSLIVDGENVTMPDAIRTGWAAKLAADVALQSADGKNTITFSPDAASAAKPGTADGDIWWQLNADSGVVLGAWRWDGSAWQPHTFGDAVLDSLSVGKLVAGEIAAGQAIIAGPENDTHAEMTDTGFYVFRKDPVSGLVEIVIKLGTSDDDYFAIVDQDGKLAASIDDTGRGNFTGLTVRDDPVIMGTPFSQWVGAIPGGGGAGTATPGARNTIGYTGDAALSGIGTEIGLLEIAVEVEAGRIYWIVPSVYWTASSTGTYLALTVRDGGTGAPSVSSPVATQDFFSTGNNAAWTILAERHRPWRFDTSGQHRLLLTAAAGGGGTVNIVNVGTNAPTLFVVDLGPDNGNPASVNRGGGSTAPPVQQYYWEGAPAATATFRGDGSQRSDTSDIVQGTDPSGYNGNGQGWWTFNLPSIAGTVDRVDFYAYANLTYLNSGGPGRFRAIHSGPPNYPIDSISLTEYDVVNGFPKPGGQTVTLPSSWWSRFRDDGGGLGARAIGIGAGPGVVQSDYVRFDGPSARLRIWYTQ